MDSAAFDAMHADWLRLFPDATCERVLRELVAVYAAPSRHYHNLRHIQDCLDLAQKCAAELQRPREVEIAIWFHDAVYDPTMKQNRQTWRRRDCARWANERSQSTGSGT